MSARLNPQIWIPSGNPDETNEASLRYPGELGQFFPWEGKGYQRALLDSGSAVTPAANQPLWYKDLDAFEVTNDFSRGLGRNFPAGVLRNAATVGRYIDMLVDGLDIVLAISSSNPAVGDIVIPSGTDGVWAFVAAGTAPTHVQCGVVTLGGTGVTTMQAQFTLGPRVRPVD